MNPEIKLDDDISPEDFARMDADSGNARPENFDLEAVEREVAGYGV